MGILAATRLGYQLERMPPIGSFPVVSLENNKFEPSPEAVLYVSPNTTEVDNLMKTIVKLVGIQEPGYQLFDSAQDADDAYR